MDIARPIGLSGGRRALGRPKSNLGADVRHGQASTSCARLKSRQLPAHTGAAAGSRALVVDHAAREADQDRRKGGPARSVRYVPACRGGGSSAAVRENPATDRQPAAEGGADMTRRVIAANRVEPAVAGLSARAELSPRRSQRDFGHASGAPIGPMEAPDQATAVIVADSARICQDFSTGRSHMGNSG